MCNQEIAGNISYHLPHLAPEETALYSAFVPFINPLSDQKCQKFGIHVAWHLVVAQNLGIRSQMLEVEGGGQMNPGRSVCVGEGRMPFYDVLFGF